MGQHSAGGRAWRTLLATYTYAGHPPCWLCGTPINYQLDGNQPDGPTGDHVIPVSLGGARLDPRNIRAAHRRCNIARKAKLHIEGPRLGQLSRRW